MGVAADISLGAINGAVAVQYIQAQVGGRGSIWRHRIFGFGGRRRRHGSALARAPRHSSRSPTHPPTHPTQTLALAPLRPLALVVKAVLKEAGLNEVFSGGLSSYCTTLMVMAHLLAAGPDAASPATADCGALLWSFFQRYSREFDYATGAVRVQAGGFGPKLADWFKPDRPAALAVEDAPRSWQRHWVGLLQHRRGEGPVFQGGGRAGCGRCARARRAARAVPPPNLGHRPDRRRVHVCAASPCVVSVRHHGRGRGVGEAAAGCICAPPRRPPRGWRWRPGAGPTPPRAGPPPPRRPCRPHRQSACPPARRACRRGAAPAAAAARTRQVCSRARRQGGRPGAPHQCAQAHGGTAYVDGWWWGWRWRQAWWWIEQEAAQGRVGVKRERGERDNDDLCFCVFGVFVFREFFPHTLSTLGPATGGHVTKKALGLFVLVSSLTKNKKQIST